MYDHLSQNESDNIHNWDGESHSLLPAITQNLRNHKNKEKIWQFLNTLSKLSWITDLSRDIGSIQWFRSLFFCILLLLSTLFFLPNFEPLYGAQSPLPQKNEFEHARAQMITPLAFGADNGVRMAATGSVLRLKDSPERPSIELTATIGRGDSFTRVLRRAGIGSREAYNIGQLVANATPLNNIPAGTPIEITLGRRNTNNSTRPLENLSFRARFDLGLTVERIGDSLALKRENIIVDDTPLRIRGKVGNSLYRSARGAGISAGKAQQFLKIISQKMAVSKIRSSDEFDIIIEHKRAETGEVKTGDLVYAGIDRGGKSHVQMLKWTQGRNNQWFEASGVGETRGILSRPVPGRVTSGFGRRRHPVLGYVRMHNGLDFKASYGTPIRAASDGRVTYSGRNGGAGKFVKIKHNKNLSTGYAHMSRIAVSRGKYVKRGQIIGYVGSTGLSTGPHLHYILYRNGRPINPNSVKFTERAQLSGNELKSFKAKLAELKSVKPGAALAPLPSKEIETAPSREIEKLSNKTNTNVKTSTASPSRRKLEIRRRTS